MEINRSNPSRLYIAGSPAYSSSLDAKNLLVVSATANTQLQRWQASRQIELLVLQVSGNKATVNIDGIEANLQGSIASRLKAGQVITATIQQGMPAPRLKITLPSVSHSEMINIEIRKRLPVQQDLDQMLSRLDNVIQRHQSNPLPVQNQLTQIRNAIQNAIYPINNLAPNIKKALDNAAVFSHQQIHQHITHGDTFPANNINLQLLRLASILRNTVDPYISNRSKPDLQTGNTIRQTNSDDIALNPLTYDAKGKVAQQLPQSSRASAIQRGNLPPQIQIMDELLNSTEGTLAKIQSHQLQMLRSEDTDLPVWLFELPVKQDKEITSFEFLIHRDPDNKNTEFKAGWQLQLRFNLDGLGEILAQIRMRPTQEIDVNFIAESDKTAELFSRHMEILGERFNNQGIVPGQLNCSCDEPDKHYHNPALQQSLIDDQI